MGQDLIMDIPNIITQLSNIQVNQCAVQNVIDGLLINSRGRISKDYVIAYMGRNPTQVFEQYK